MINAPREQVVEHLADGQKQFISNDIKRKGLTINPPMNNDLIKLLLETV